jgi:hypothetical protein
VVIFMTFALTPALSQAWEREQIASLPLSLSLSLSRTRERAGVREIPI